MASRSQKSATRNECPAVVGSRASIACTAGLDKTLEQALDVGVQHAVLDRHAGLPGERLRQLPAARIERSHMGGNVIGRAQQHVRTVLAIDQLQHPHDLAALVGERQREQRLRVIIDGAIRGRVESIGRGFRNGVGIVQQHGLATASDITGNAVLTNQRLLGVGRGSRGCVLPQTEVQDAVAVARVDRGTVRAGKTARVGENE